MRVCIVGSGGREHALAHALARTADVVVTPGNPGMAPPLTVTAAPAEEIEADLFVIGPEAPLVDGLAGDVAGEIVLRDAKSGPVLDRWAGDGDFWVRRSALLALLRGIRAGQPDLPRFTRYAEPMLTEKVKPMPISTHHGAFQYANAR